MSRCRRAPPARADIAQIIARAVIAFGDIAAVRRVDWRSCDERALEQVDQRTVPPKARRNFLEERRRRGEAVDPFAKQPRAIEAVAQLAEIARRPAPGRDPAQRATLRSLPDIGRAPAPV